MSDRHDVWTLLDGIQMDIRGATNKMVALRALVSQLELPAPTALDCPVCGLTTKGPRTLAEHLYVTHEGEVPSFWEETEAPSS